MDFPEEKTNDGLLIYGKKSIDNCDIKLMK